VIPKSSYLAAKVVLLKLPFWRRTSDYRRFVIVCRHRSGSHLLRGLLNSHRRILALGELFRDPERGIGYDLPLMSASRENRRLFRTDPVGFLERRIFEPYPSYVSAAGFKVIYYQLERPGTQPIRDHLRDRKDLKILHLKRRDALRTYLSHLQAMQHRRWVNTTGVKQRHRPVTIDAEAFLEDYRTAREQEGRYAELFRHHQQIDLFYEDLVADLAGEMRRVQAFLGVEHRRVVPLTYKQSYLPLSAAISNYTEIEEELAPFISAP
jgi:LPS sulfotransferase NodH